MKKSICLIVLTVLIFSYSVKPTYAALPSFTLQSGTLKFSDNFDASFNQFWRGLVIELSDDGTGILTGSASGSASAVSQDGHTTFATNGNINGVYDPKTGNLTGDYSVTNLQVFHREVPQSITHYETSRIYQGSITAQIQPSATSVAVSCNGTFTQTVTGNYPAGWTANGEEINFTTKWGINVDFAIEGTVPHTMEEAASEVEIPDSGARFSDLSGMVEMLVPTGYDENGKEIYEGEVWEFAKLDKPLPYGTRIRTVGRSSTVILSFEDMTTYEMQGEYEIILSKPTEKTGHLRLIWGSLKNGVRNMLKDGSMEIEMSQAVCGIKGTTFVLEETGTLSTLKVLEGVVEFTSRVTGEVETIEAGQMIAADEKGLGEVEKFEVAVEEQNWSGSQGEPGQVVTEEAEPTPKTDASGTKSPGTCPGSAVIFFLVGMGLKLIAPGNRRRVNPSG